jgi:hypothetical protein
VRWTKKIEGEKRAFSFPKIGVKNAVELGRKIDYQQADK